MREADVTQETSFTTAGLPDRFEDKYDKPDGEFIPVPGRATGRRLKLVEIRE